VRLANFLYTIPLRLRSVFRRDVVERELDDELRYHVDQQIAQNVARGMTADAARTAALIAMGGVERRKDDVREARRVEVVENLLRDLRFALRTLRQSPSYAFVAIVTLALGIGANTAIFSAVHAVLMKDLAYDDPGRLVTLGYGQVTTVAAGVYFDWQETTRSFSHMGVEEYWTPHVMGTDRPEQLVGVRASPSMFPLLGVAPLLGRAMLPDEAQAGRNRVIVISYGFWKSRFAGDSGVIGRTLRLDAESYRVIGVMPRGFQFTPYWASEADVATPLILAPRREDRSGASLRVFARLAPGVSIDNARADVRRVGARLERLYPGTNQGVTITPLREEVVGSVKSALVILLGAVGLVLLIACANVAHLQLVRATSRTRELALRTALGASRTRVVQQALTESLVLAAIGGLAGLAIATVGVKMFVALAPPSIPRLGEIGMDPVVFAFAAAITMVAGVGCGLMPAIRVTHVPSHDVLKDSGRTGGESRRHLRTRGALIVSEFALAVVLLAGAGLLMRSFVALLEVDPGYDRAHVLSMQVSVVGTEHASVEQRAQFFGNVVDRVRQVPGVEAASAINHVPLNGDDWRFPFSIEGRPVASPGKEAKAEFLVVQPGYFRTMGIRLLRGEEVSDARVATAEHVVVISETMAEKFWPAENPVGKRISVDDPATHPDWFRIIGVARDVRQSSWTQRTDQMYFPYIHDPRRPEREMSLASFLHPNYMTLVVRTTGDPAGMLGTVRSVVHEMDPQAPIAAPVTMSQAIDEEFATPRFYAVLIGSLATIAVLLAGIGIYGVISYSVARRTHEIGIRVALGAQESQVFRMIIMQGIRLAAIGGVIGVIGALAVTRYIGALLYETAPTDPLTFVAVIAMLGATAAAACWLPARRALAAAPADALRAT
jgi:putative ABC transport system permease protein